MANQRPLKLIELTDDERSKLESWTRKSTCPQRLVMRAQIVLFCAQLVKVAASSAILRWAARFCTRQKKMIWTGVEPVKNFLLWMLNVASRRRFTIKSFHDFVR